MPEYRVEILPEAMNELREIALFHMQEVGPNSARKITDKILNSLDRLGIFPLSSPYVPDETLKIQGYRMIVCGKYLCFYRLTEKIVFVYHIAHGATDYSKLFTSTPPPC